VKADALPSMDWGPSESRQPKRQGRIDVRCRGTRQSRLLARHHNTTMGRLGDRENEACESEMKAKKVWRCGLDDVVQVRTQDGGIETATTTNITGAGNQAGGQSTAKRF
jgi:hypothetical protein